MLHITLYKTTTEQRTFYFRTVKTLEFIGPHPQAETNLTALSWLDKAIDIVHSNDVDLIAKGESGGTKKPPKRKNNQGKNHFPLEKKCPVIRGAGLWYPTQILE